MEGKMKNLFIDTNIWLSLYDFTSNDLGEFLKLKEHIGDSVKLIFLNKFIMRLLEIGRIS